MLKEGRNEKVLAIAGAAALQGGGMDFDILNVGTRISLEIGVPMKVEMEGVAIPLTSSFVGIEGNFILIRTPSPYHLIKHKLFKGCELIVKYISHGTVYAFQAKLFGIISEPIRLLVLEYPKVVQRHELRSDKRANCFIPSTIVAGDDEYLGAIVDIAKRGCCCVINKPKDIHIVNFNIDDEILLRAKFPGINGQVPLECAVKNVKKNRKELVLGLIFNDRTAKDSQKIVNWYVSTIETFAD